MLAMSEPLRNVMVPPGWMSAFGAVEGAAVMLLMAPVTALFVIPLVVAVVLFAVVLVVDPLDLVVVVTAPDEAGGAVVVVLAAPAAWSAPAPLSTTVEAVVPAPVFCGFLVPPQPAASTASI